MKISFLLLRKDALLHLSFVLIFQIFYSLSFSQSAWNNNSFKFSRDNAILENMTGSTPITFSGVLVSSSTAITFQNFTFQFGLKKFNHLYVSPFGFIKLGSNITSNDPINDSNVIVPLYNGSVWSAHYKLLGSTPNQKLVIEFIGVMQPSGEPTSFQVWIFERIGKIQFLYSHLRAYDAIYDSWNYKIYCSTPIFNKTNIVSVKNKPNNAYPTISYSTITSSSDSIYANTRYTLEPDTIKPAIPSFNFTDIQAGCLKLNITENSNNESTVVLERADVINNYHFENLNYFTNYFGTTTFSLDQKSLQPFTNYSYRLYVSNGFVNSDTIYNSVQTLMPQLDGIKKIPGNYSSITALLQDAACKHIGPNLVIELQSNYSFALESLPIAFTPNLQNRFIQTIVIRPAANANITWADSTLGPLFYVDSVKHVFLDGRPGGTGNLRNLTLYQKNPTRLTIQYTNAADSGGVNFCKIIKKNYSNLSYSIAVVPRDISYGYDKKDIDAFSLTNNIITADSATVSDLVYIKPADTTKAKNFVISGNEFSRFRKSAIYFENGGENLLIKNNSFFQPLEFHPEIFLPLTHASCIALINTEKVTVDNNFFGGGSSTWGVGKFQIKAPSSDFAFIDYENTSNIKKAFITNNKFGNISLTGGYGIFKLIYAYKGDILIDGNQFGTSDSTNSITSSYLFWGIDLWYGNKIVSNNFFSGFQGGYLTNDPVNHSYFCTLGPIDSVTVLNNDFGGSNNINANSSTGVISALNITAKNKIIIKNNVFRGISSKKNFVNIIDGEQGIATHPLDRIEIDSNSIHHIQAASKVNGIVLLANNNNRVYQISYNTIYALKSTGIMQGYYGPEGIINGINYIGGSASDSYVGEVQIFGNRIHSFESVRVLPTSTYIYNAILCQSPISKIYNNEIRLGLNTNGQKIDSNTTINGIVINTDFYGVFLNNKYYVEHNSIYIGGKGYLGSAIRAVTYDYNNQNKNFITMTNNILYVDRVPLSSSSITPSVFQDIQYFKATSAKNIWFSKTISNTSALLQNYKQSCNCDFSSFVADPILINPIGDSANFNMHLGNLSAADSSGTPSTVNIQRDLDGKLRNEFSPVDIGCYAATPCLNGIFPTINIVYPLTDSLQLCSGSSIVLRSSITGGSFNKLQWQNNLADIASANSDTLVINSAGNYRLVGKNTCGLFASRIIKVVSYGITPTVSITTPKDTICENTPVTFNATTNLTGSIISYQWQVNGINVGSNSSSFTAVSLTNNALVKVITSYTACGTPTSFESNTIKMTIISAPVANAGNDISICSGSSTILNGSGGTSYSWSPTTGLSNPLLSNPVASPATSTAYVVTAFNQYGCFSKDTVIVNIISALNPSVYINASTTNICFGTPVTFTAIVTNGGNAPTYTWYVNSINTGATNSNIYITNSLTNNDEVKVLVKSNFSCLLNDTSSSNIVKMSVRQLDIPLITLNNGTLSVTNPDNNAVYTWQVYKNSAWANVVPLSNGINFAVIDSGEYRVKALKDPCIKYSASQNARFVVSSSNSVRLHPNPANNYIIIDSISIVDKWKTLDILDLSGRAVLPTIFVNSQTRIYVNISTLINGTYFSVLKREDGSFLTNLFVKL